MRSILCSVLIHSGKRVGKPSSKLGKLACTLIVLLLCPALFASGIMESGIATYGLSVGGTVMDNILSLGAASMFDTNTDSYFTLGLNISGVNAHNLSSSLGLGLGSSVDFSAMRTDGDWSYRDDFVFGLGLYFRPIEKLAVSLVVGPAIGFTTDLIFDIGLLGLDASITYFLSKNTGITAGLNSYSWILEYDDSWNADLSLMSSIYIGVSIVPLMMR